MTNDITISQYKATPTSLSLPSIPLDDWADLGHKLSQLKDSQLWWLGDWVLYGERFGEEASQYLDSLGYSYETLRNAAWVCRSWPPPERKYKNLTFSHYQAVTALDASLAADLLQIASNRGQSVSQLRIDVNLLTGKESKKREKKCPNCGYVF